MRTGSTTPSSGTDPALCCAPIAAPTLTPAQAAGTAEVFKALADPARVMIVNLLAQSAEPVCACDFTAPLELSQPTVSHHLKKLTAAGLLRREARGKWAYYSLNGEAIDRLAAIVELKGVCCR